MNTTENLDPAAIERSRTTRILAMAEQAARQGMTVDANRAIAEGATPDQFREQIYERLISRQSNFTPGAPAPEYSRNEQRDMSRYSLLRAITMAGQGRLDGIEFEMSRELARTMGKSPDGFFVPNSALLGLRAGMSVGNDGGNYGGDAVGLQTMPFLAALRPMMMVAQAGATVLSGLSSNVGIPKQVTASSAGWKGETAESDEASQEIDQLLLSPKRITVWSKFSKMLLAQTSGDVENFVRLDLLTAIAAGYDSAAINGAGSAGQPTGILATAGIGSVAGGTNGLAPTWAHLVALVAAVANGNAAGGRPGFLFSTKVEGKLRSTVKVASTDSKMILEDGQESLVGKPWYASNNSPDSLTKGSSSGVCSALIFGNWQDLILANFGSGVDLIVDAVTLATSGQTKVVANSYCDVAVRRAQSFSSMKDALTA